MHTHVHVYTHIYTRVHKSLQCSLDTAIFTFVFSELDQFTETNSATHSQPMVGMSSKEEEAASSRAAGNG